MPKLKLPRKKAQSVLDHAFVAGNALQRVCGGLRSRLIDMLRAAGVKKISPEAAKACEAAEDEIAKPLEEALAALNKIIGGI
jgi:hypothetical protein